MLLNTLQYFPTAGGQSRRHRQHTKVLKILPIPSALISDGAPHTAHTTGAQNYLRFPGPTADHRLLTKVTVFSYLTGQIFPTFQNVAPSLKLFLTFQSLVEHIPLSFCVPNIS